MWKLQRLLNYAIHLGSKSYEGRIISGCNGVTTSFCTGAQGLQRKKLEGKVAVITGAASGIGRATAKLFVAEGAKVVIADIQDELGQQLAKTLGSHSRFFHCDVTNEMDSSDVVDFALAEHGKLDIMLNNAAVLGAHTSITQVNMKEFDKLMGVNLRGMVLGTKYAARAMIPAKQGCIICTASVAALMGGGAPHSYSISKHAVIGLMKSVAGELNAHGIRVNCISPYAIATPLALNNFKKRASTDLTAESLGEAFDRASGFYGAKFEADDIARVAAFLASEEARHISGHNMVVDGAYSTFKLFNPLSQQDCEAV